MTLSLMILSFHPPTSFPPSFSFYMIFMNSISPRLPAHSLKVPTSISRNKLRVSWFSLNFMPHPPLLPQPFNFRHLFLFFFYNFPNCPHAGDSRNNEAPDKSPKVLQDRIFESSGTSFTRRPSAHGEGRTCFVDKGRISGGPRHHEGGEAEGRQ